MTRLFEITHYRRRQPSRDGLLKTRVRVKVLGLTVWSYLRPSRSQGEAR